MIYLFLLTVCTICHPSANWMVLYREQFYINLRMVGRCCPVDEVHGQDESSCSRCGIGGALKALLRWSLGEGAHCCPVETARDHGGNCTASKHPKCLHTGTWESWTVQLTSTAACSCGRSGWAVTFSLFETGQGLKSKDCWSLTQIPCVVNVKQKISPAGTTHQ